MGKDEEALQTLDKSKGIIEKIEPNGLLAGNIYFNIGRIHEKHRSCEKAKKYYELSLPILVKSGDLEAI